MGKVLGYIGRLHKHVTSVNSKQHSGLEVKQIIISNKNTYDLTNELENLPRRPQVRLQFYSKRVPNDTKGKKLLS